LRLVYVKHVEDLSKTPGGSLGQRSSLLQKAQKWPYAPSLRLKLFCSLLLPFQLQNITHHLWPIDVKGDSVGQEWCLPRSPNLTQAWCLDVTLIFDLLTLEVDRFISLPVYHLCGCANLQQNLFIRLQNNAPAQHSISSTDMKFWVRTIPSAPIVFAWFSTEWLLFVS